MDATPGYFTHTWFKVPSDKAGTTFRGQCAELCGRNHADMVAYVRAVEPSEFEAWLDQRQSDIEDANAEAQKQRQALEGEDADTDPASEENE
jgi:cytochrome c oxidase subunit 2